MKRTYQPSKLRRARLHGPLLEWRPRWSQSLRNRRAKGRESLTV